MNRKHLPTLLISLIGSTALTTAVFAQSSHELISQGNTCGALAALAQEQPDRLNPEWLAEANLIVQSDNQAQCMVFYDDATTALVRLDSGEEMDEDSGRIIVTQPDPSVTVQQDAPEVVVTQPAPEITVRQGQPEIIVRQAPPTVTVEIPQPLITIDQPQPEIIVRMPDPEVGVTTADPEVQVSQSEPTVTVEQAEPEVQVELAEPDVDVDGQSEANVTINQGQPIVRQNVTDDTADVTIQQAQPMVTFESAEPNVIFEESPEPRVEFTESGEPNIRFEDHGQQANAQEARQPHLVRDINGMPVVASNGAVLGNVDRLVTDGERNYAVLAEAGLSGAGAREVVLPLSNVAVAEDRLVVIDMTEEDINAMSDFDMAGFQEIGVEYEVNLRTE